VTVGAETSAVVNAVFEAARSLGWTVSAFDRADRCVYLDQAHGLHGFSRHFVVAATDNGLGGTTLQVSWPTSTRRRLFDPHGRYASQLCGRVRAIVAGG